MTVICAEQSHEHLNIPVETIDTQGFAFHSDYFCKGHIRVVLIFKKQLQTHSRENKLVGMGGNY